MKETMNSKGYNLLLFCLMTNSNVNVFRYEFNGTFYSSWNPVDVTDSDMIIAS